jgi:uncharacterized membrane protein
VQCPNCQRENEPTSRFCIFCGSALQVPQARPPGAPAPGPADTLSQQLQALQEEVRRLTERLAALERMQGVVIPPARPAPTPPTMATPSPELAPKLVAKTTAAAQVPPPPPSKAAPAKEREWEQILGGNWLARIGVLLLIIGVAFFLKFAFDNNWLNPTSRVVLGVLASLAMLWSGYHWQRQYPVFAQALSGGGIALLYLSIFAAFAPFDLIPFYPAMGILVLVSVGSAVLAIRYNSMSLAILGILGAFIAPFVLGASSAEIRESTTDDQGFRLLAYIMVVDLGVIALSAFRTWRWFTLLGLLGSLASFGVWYSEFGDGASLLASEGSLTLIFLIFVGATTLYHIVWRWAPSDFDYILMVINAAAYFGISYGLLWEDLRDWLGGFSLLLALFYGGLAYVARKRGTENLRLSLFALGIALVFLTIAIPVQLGDRAWTTIAWAAEGTVLMWLSFTLRMPHLRSCSYAVYAITAVRLTFFDSTAPHDFQPFLNERFLAFIVSIAALYLTGYLLWRERNALREWEKHAWSIYPIFLIAATFFLTLIMPLELGNKVWTTIAWAAEGIALVWLSLSRRTPQFRICSYAVFVLVAVRLMFFDTAVNLSTFQPVVNERFLAFVVSIATMYLAAYLLWRERNTLLQWEKATWSVYPIFLVAANFFSLWLLSFEVWHYFGSQASRNAQVLSLTAVWAVYAVILLVVGIVKRSPPVRLVALALLAIPIVKVFVYDVFTLERVYRITAFIGLGILLIASSYLYQRYSKAIKGFILRE